MHGTATYRCDDTRDCIIQFCPPDDEHMCSKYVDASNKLIIKFSPTSWLILINKYTVNLFIEHRLRMGSTQPPIQKLPVALSPQGKRQGRETTTNVSSPPALLIKYDNLKEILQILVDIQLATR